MTCADDKWVKLYIAKALVSFVDVADEVFGRCLPTFSLCRRGTGVMSTNTTLDHLLFCQLSTQRGPAQKSLITSNCSSLPRSSRLSLSLSLDLEAEADFDNVYRYYTGRAIVPPAFVTISDVPDTPPLSRHSPSTFPLAHLETAFGIKILEPTYVEHSQSQLLGQSSLDPRKGRDDKKWNAVTKKEKQRRTNTAVSLSRPSEVGKYLFPIQPKPGCSRDRID